MAKESTGAALKTPDLLLEPKKKRGRKSTGQALTGAQRVANLRASRKAAGCCPCCGRPLD